MHLTLIIIMYKNAQQTAYQGGLNLAGVEDMTIHGLQISGSGEPLTENFLRRKMMIPLRVYVVIQHI